MPPSHQHPSRTDLIDPATELALRTILDEKLDPINKAVVELKTIAALQAQTNAGQAITNEQTRTWMGIHVREYHESSAQIAKVSDRNSSTGKWLKRHPFVGKIFYGVLYVIGTSIGLWLLTTLLPAVATALAHNAHP